MKKFKRTSFKEGFFYKFINKDVKEFNGILLSLFSILFLVGVGFISYTLTNNSYALFGDSLTGSKTIEIEASTPLSGAETIIEKVGAGGLEAIYHDCYLHLGTTQIDDYCDMEEYRYRGANPSNYVSFNDELWRIIGVFPTDDGTGNIENRIKIIKNDSIGAMYWNSTFNDETESYNNWINGSLDMYLNNDYYNTLEIEAQNMIETTKYYLGGYSHTSVMKEDMYFYERKFDNSDGGEYYYGSNPNSTISKIALMYASDYGYAASDDCTQVLQYYDDIICTNNNWLYWEEVEWILPQFSSDSSGAFDLDSNVDGGAVYLDLQEVRPVLYLSSDVMITGGTGTSSDPYILSK